VADWGGGVSAGCIAILIVRFKADYPGDSWALIITQFIVQNNQLTKHLYLKRQYGRSTRDDR